VGCFAAPAMTARHSLTVSRLDAPEVCQKFPTPRSEGAGNAGRPIAACAEVLVVSTRVSQVTPEIARIPRAMVCGLLRALFGDWAFLSPSSAASAADLNASVGASGPHDFAVRIWRPRLKRHPRPPHSVTIASRPSVGLYLNPLLCCRDHSWRPLRAKKRELGFARSSKNALYLQCNQIRGSGPIWG
jgi:hypothetical protein